MSATNLLEDEIHRFYPVFLGSELVSDGGTFSAGRSHSGLPRGAFSVGQETGQPEWPVHAV